MEEAKLNAYIDSIQMAGPRGGIVTVCGSILISQGGLGVSTLRDEEIEEDEEMKKDPKYGKSYVINSYSSSL